MKDLYSSVAFFWNCGFCLFIFEVCCLIKHWLIKNVGPNQMEKKKEKKPISLERANFQVGPLKKTLRGAFRTSWWGSNESVKRKGSVLGRGSARGLPMTLTALSTLWQWDQEASGPKLSVHIVPVSAAEPMLRGLTGRGCWGQVQNPLVRGLSPSLCSWDVVLTAHRRHVLYSSYKTPSFVSYSFHILIPSTQTETYLIWLYSESPDFLHLNMDTKFVPALRELLGNVSQGLSIYKKSLEICFEGTRISCFLSNTPYSNQESKMFWQSPFSS